MPGVPRWRLVTAVALVGAASCAAPPRSQPPWQGGDLEQPAAAPDFALPLCKQFEKSPPPVGGPVSDDPEVAAAQHQRARLGFPSDVESTLAALAASSEDGDPAASEDIPYLTPEEDREIQARNELDLGPVVAYAADHPETYGGLWIDQLAGGVITVAFTERMEEHEAALAELMGDTPFRVVSVDHSAAELEQEQDRANAALKDWGETNFATGSGNRMNRVSLSIGYLDPEEVAFLAERLDPDKVCLEGSLEPPPEPGPQAASGPGWRLLADQTEGHPYTVSVAVGPRSLERMWSQFRLEGPLPEVDFDEEMVVLLTHAVGGSCPEIRLDALVVEEDRAFGTFSHPTGDHVACTDDANPHSYVLAVERRVLPDRFVLQLTEEDICRGCEEDVLVVDLNDPEFEDRLVSQP